MARTNFTKAYVRVLVIGLALFKLTKESFIGFQDIFNVEEYTFMLKTVNDRRFTIPLTQLWI